MGVMRTAPSGNDDVRFLAVGKASGADTVPVSVGIGTEERAMLIVGRAIGSNGTVIEVTALGRREATGFTWGMTGTNLVIDSESVIAFEVPEVLGVSWFASLSFEFCGLGA